jgi:hypothetical protein
MYKTFPAKQFVLKYTHCIWSYNRPSLDDVAENETLSILLFGKGTARCAPTMFADGFLATRELR